MKMAEVCAQNIIQILIIALRRYGCMSTIIVKKSNIFRKILFRKLERELTCLIKLHAFEIAASIP